jgi:Protein kinase domain
MYGTTIRLMFSFTSASFCPHVIYFSFCLQVFLDAENNVQLGDFGLATKHDSKLTSTTNQDEDAESEASSMYSAIEDISRLMGGSVHSSKISTTEGQSWAGESMTGGVGTTFYRAPEQEGQVGTRPKGDSSSYTVQADIFSFGVILFEMFHPPFDTYMERAETLTTLRGDRQAEPNKSADIPLGFRQLAESRFPKSFVESVPENAQRLILLCLERDPLKRPSAEDLLKSDLLPRKIELEQRYLEEALQLLTSSQSSSYVQILNALFARPTMDAVNLTFDTDVAVKANNMSHVRGGKQIATPPELLVRAVAEIRSGALDMSALGSIAMSASSLLAATSALNRARNTGKLGKGGRGMIKRAAQRTAGIMAMRAATAAAVTGAHDGVHGADPIVVESIKRFLVSIFQNHGAVLLKSPLLRPRPSHAVAALSSSTGGPAEVINSRGAVLVLPEDLTAPFARALGRGGSATSNLKRYDIDRVFHRALAGGHPRESMEASFDIVHEEHNNAREILGETIIVASEVIGLLPSHDGERKLPFGARSPIWFLRLSHTRLADSILELCGVPPKEGVRRVVLGILTRFTAPSPHVLSVYFSTQTSGKQSLHGERAERMKLMELMDNQLNEAASLHGLPTTAETSIVHSLLLPTLTGIARKH